MIKETTYKEKLSLLKEWFPNLIEDVKKDLKNDHLKQDLRFFKQYFPTKNINKIGITDLVEGYQIALAENDKAEDIAEFISNRWILKNSDLYQYFEEELKKINPDFTEIKELDPATSRSLIKEASAQFGSVKTYLFSVLNSVVLSKEVYQQLSEQAKHDALEEKSLIQSHSEKQRQDNLHRSREIEINRLTDKYEKKLQGLEKKYITDVDALKKQVALLQRKLNG